MDRNDYEEALRAMAPKIIAITLTSDMGYEFSALTANGIIWSEPGMLMDYSGGQWPLEDVSKSEELQILEQMLEHFESYTMAWSKFVESDLKELYDELTTIK